MQKKRIRTMILKERNLFNLIVANPREYRRSIMYFCVSGFCTGLAVVCRLVA